MKLIQDIISWIKEWNDWQLKDWIKAIIVVAIVLLILKSCIG